MTSSAPDLLNRPALFLQILRDGMATSMVSLKPEHARTTWVKWRTTEVRTKKRVPFQDVPKNNVPVWILYLKATPIRHSFNLSALKNLKFQPEKADFSSDALIMEASIAAILISVPQLSALDVPTCIILIQ
jgi:hypothetical protein